MIQMENIRLNSKIELIAEDDSKIAGTVHDLVDGKIYVAVTAQDLKERILRPGEDVEAILYGDNEILSFEALISDRRFEDISLYEVSNISNLTKAQRRRDVRVSCSININYTDNKYLVNADFKKEELDRLLKEISNYLEEGIILDLSGGGLRLATRRNLEKGTRLLLNFKLERELLLKGKIVHKEINVLPDKTNYFYGVKFIDIEEEIREEIIKYVFILMRKQSLK